MCGICGLVWRSAPMARAESGERAVRQMVESLGHRGPDAANIITSGRTVLGHVRLAVIDLEGSAQPMASPDGKVLLSYNGEVYNFQDVERDCRSRGWAFRSRGDTEVLLASYCQTGPVFDEALNGMYSYAVLDQRDGDGEILLATDPVGVKPLFLYSDNDVVLFASELRAIEAGLASLGKPAIPSAKGITAYLTNGWVPAPLSLIENTRRLEPGERWRIDCGSGEIKLHSRRELPQTAELDWSAEGLNETLRETLEQAITRQVISDVPLGFFLSGGIDSSLCLAIAAKNGIDTSSFTIRFGGDGHGVAAADEADIARAVANRLGSKHHEFTLDADTMVDSLDAVFAAMDQPLADPACLPLYHLSRYAREHVTVCLAGDGGDELFAGYPRHQLVRAKQIWGKVPGPLRRMARSIAHTLPKSPTTGPAEYMRKARTGFRLLDGHGYMEPLFEGVASAGNDPSPWHGPVGYTARSLQAMDFEGQLAGQMLVKTDSMTMAASLECRVPLLDLELVKLASSIPIDRMRQGGVGKLPLRQLLREYLPPEITDRPKRGFRVPLTSWFRHELADRISDTFKSGTSLSSAYLPQETIHAIVDAHLSGRAEKSLHIWSLLALESWLERPRGLSGGPS